MRVSAEAVDAAQRCLEAAGLVTSVAEIGGELVLIGGRRFVQAGGVRVAEDSFTILEKDVGYVAHVERGMRVERFASLDEATAFVLSAYEAAAPGPRTLP